MPLALEDCERSRKHPRLSVLTNATNMMFLESWKQHPVAPSIVFQQFPQFPQGMATRKLPQVRENSDGKFWQHQAHPLNTCRLNLPAMEGDESSVPPHPVCELMCLFSHKKENKMYVYIYIYICIYIHDYIRDEIHISRVESLQGICQITTSYALEKQIWF